MFFHVLRKLLIMLPVFVVFLINGNSKFLRYSFNRIHAANYF